jgi:hypothetical protein
MPALTSRPHTKWPVAVVLGVVGSLVVGLIVLAFLWPTRTAEARDLPIGISGPAASVSAVKTAVDANAKGAIDFVSADDRADAVSQIKTRDTYGAIVLSDSPTTPPEVLTAPAASPAAAQLLSGLAAQLQAHLAEQVAAAGGDPSAVKVTVTTVVPLSDADPTGAGLVAASFPMMLGGMAGGVLVSLLVVGPLRRLAALAGFGIGVGLILAFVLDTWFGYLPGDFWLVALGLGTSVIATSAFIVGCASLVGTAGIGIGAAITLLFANPLSAAATPWQFLAAPWGAIGQFFVPGASAWLLRSIAYFPDADVSKQWWILAGWIALGVVLTLAGHFRGRATMHVPAATLEEGASSDAAAKTGPALVV